MLGCAGLAVTLPLPAVLGGLAVLATGLAHRAVRLALARRDGVTE